LNRCDGCGVESGDSWCPRCGNFIGVPDVAISPPSAVRIRVIVFAVIVFALGLWWIVKSTNTTALKALEPAAPLAIVVVVYLYFKAREGYRGAVRREAGAEDAPIRCSRCGSAQITADRKGFGAGKALTGAVATGGIGLLAGFIGSRRVIVTCLKCGEQWTAGTK
jgi:hypothetical protein